MKPWRLFLAYVAASLVPVLALGVVLSVALDQEARRRGVAEGSAEAGLVARTAIEPLLDGRVLSVGLSTSEKTALRRMTDQAVGAGHVVRLRLRDLDGRVVFSDDGSGFGEEPEDEAVEARQRGGRGEPVTRLNSDRNDTGPAGAAGRGGLPAADAWTAPAVGVLEIYLPYEPIHADVTAGLRTLYLRTRRRVSLALWTILAGYLGLHHPPAAPARRPQRLPRRPRHAHRAAQPRAVPAARGRAPTRPPRRPTAASAAVVVIDLDRFKEVNDTLGHHNGDALLRQLGERLAATSATGDTVARLGGDEFGLVLPAVTRGRGTRAAATGCAPCSSSEVIVGTLPLTAGGELRLRARARRRRLTSTTAAARRRRDVPGQGEPRRARPLRPRAGPLRRRPARAGGRAAPGHRAATSSSCTTSPRRPVPTATVVRRRGAGPLAAPASAGCCCPDAFLPVAEQTGLIDAADRWVVRRRAAPDHAPGPSGSTLAMAVNISARNLAPGRTSPTRCWPRWSSPASRPTGSDPRDHRDRAARRPRAAAGRPRTARGRGVPGQHRRLRPRPDLAGLPVARCRCTS